MLSHSVEFGHLLLAALLGIFIPRMMRPFIKRTPHIHWTRPSSGFCGALGYRNLQHSRRQIGARSNRSFVPQMVSCTARNPA